MTKINAGTDFSDTQIPLVDELNSLMDAATLTGLTAAALSSGAHFFENVVAAPPGTEGDNYIDTTTGLLTTSDGSAFSTDRTDPLEWTLTNNFGAGMTAGDVVVLDQSQEDSFTQADAAADYFTRVAGVLKANTADGVAGQVYVRGDVDVLLTGGGDPGDRFVVSPNSSNAVVVADPLTSGLFDAGQFGMLLEADDGLSGAVLVRAHIWR